MGSPATGDDAGRRIGLFCVGATVATLAAFVGWVAFAFSASNFYADWWQGWAEARERLAASPGLAMVVGASAAVVSLGVWCMGRAVVGDRARRPKNVL